MSQCCAVCVFFKTSKSGHTCGVCDYPVPEWIRISVSGGGYIGNEAYSGKECPTFKSRADVLEETKEK